MVKALGSSSSKVIFILMTEVIISYMELTTIYIRLFCLQQLLAKFVKKENMGFQDCSKNFKLIFFCILGNKKIKKINNKINNREVNWELVIARF